MKTRMKKTSRELGMSVFLKLMDYRTGTYFELRKLDLITLENETAFDAVVLSVLASLGFDVEVWCWDRGVIEHYDHRARRKTWRWMNQTEWHSRKKLKTEQLRILDPAEFCKRKIGTSAA